MTQLSISFPKHYALLSPDEIYENVDQSLLSALEEDRRIERKPPTFPRKDIGDYICMWANTLPEGGLLVLGMGDKRGFPGCHKISVNQLNEIEKCHHVYCPDAKVQSKRVDVRADDGASSYVVVLRVGYREDKVVRTASGQAFIRRGDEKHLLTEPEIHELEIDKRQVDIEKESVNLSFPEDFDLDLVRKFVEGVKKVHQTVQKHQDIEVLVQRKLGKMKNSVFVPNMACALAFAKDLMALDVVPGCLIKFLRIDGEIEQSGDKYNVIKTINLEGSVPVILEKAANEIGTQLREFSVLGEDRKFYTAPEYPQDAWYEAVVNACVHRSYGLKNMNVFVKMFDDKLVIESPGGFPPLVTPENIYTMHHPRNPTLMHALFYLGIVKEHAEGTKRMRDTMKGMNLPPPQFDQIESGSGFAMVKVTLRNHIKQRKVWVDRDVTQILGDALTKNLSPDEKRILNFVAEHGRINVTQSLKLLPDVGKWHGAKKVLMRLVKNGMLQQVHSRTVQRDSHSYYALPEAYKEKGK